MKKRFFPPEGRKLSFLTSGSIPDLAYFEAGSKYAKSWVEPEVKNEGKFYLPYKISGFFSYLRLRPWYEKTLDFMAERGTKKLLLLFIFFCSTVLQSPVGLNYRIPYVYCTEAKSASICPLRLDNILAEQLLGCAKNILMWKMEFLFFHLFLYTSFVASCRAEKIMATNVDIDIAP